MVGALRWAAALICTAFSLSASASFIAFESGQVRPLAISPDGSTLFAVNTPDNQLEIFSIGGGRFARAFIGVTPGWFAGKAAVVSAEEVASHLDQIRDPSGHTVPNNIGDELGLIMKAFSS